MHPVATPLKGKQVFDDDNYYCEKGRQGGDGR